VDEENISDLETQKLNKLIKQKVEENLDYPGMIKIVTIRENTVTSYIA
jgi:ribonuclease Y